MRRSGRAGRTPSMNMCSRPRLRSTDDRVAVETPFSSSAVRVSRCGGRASSGTPPYAAARSASVNRGMAPYGASGIGESTIVLDSRPAVPSSTSTVSPGSTTEAPAGVPVRMMSPTSSVMRRERSATSWSKGKIRSAVVASWTSVPLTQVRRRRSARSTDAGSTQNRPDRREPVRTLGAHVGAAVRVAQVVYARVVGDRDPLHVGHGALGRYTAGGPPDDECDLALEGHQPATGGPLDHGVMAGERRRRLEEVRRAPTGSCRARPPGSGS